MSNWTLLDWITCLMTAAIVGVIGGHIWHWIMYGRQR